MNLLRLRRRLSIAVLIALILSFILISNRQTLAQQAVTSATLSGTIQDANGAAISGVSITVTNLETNQSRVTAADAAGRYRFSSLPVGQYRLAASARGFVSTTRAPIPSINLDWISSPPWNAQHLVS